MSEHKNRQRLLTLICMASLAVAVCCLFMPSPALADDKAQKEQQRVKEAGRRSTRWLTAKRHSCRPAQQVGMRDHPAFRKERRFHHCWPIWEGLDVLTSHSLRIADVAIQTGESLFNPFLLSLLSSNCRLNGWDSRSRPIPLQSGYEPGVKTTRIGSTP